MTTTQEMYDKRAKLVTDMQSLTVGAAKEGRALTTEESEKWDKMEADEAAISKTIRATESTEKLVTEQSAKHFGQIDAQGKVWTSTSTEDRGKDKAYEEAFENYFRYGMSYLDTEQKGLMSEKRGTSSQVVGTTTLGGYTVPTGFYPEIEKAMLEYSGIMQAARIIRTDSGNALPWPTEDDTSTVALLVAEAAAFTVQDLTFGQKQLDAYKYGTLAKISYELLQDSAFNMSAELVSTFGTRFGRAMNASGTTGTGSSQPNGVVTASTLGKTTASATAITVAEVIDLKHSIDPAYRGSQSFGFMFHDSVLAYLKKLAIGASDARPLWQPSFREGAPDTIDGTRYWINQGMDSSIDTASKIMLAGDFSKFVVRMVKDLTVLRLDELYSANGLVGFQAHMRWDSECINTAAIKHMLTA
jgi:HK97 family phage major capsid protein